MRDKFGSWLKRACAVRSLKFGVIRGSSRFGGKKPSWKSGTCKMAFRRRNKSYPFFSQEFLIQNHADIVFSLVIFILIGLMFEVSSRVWDSRVFLVWVSDSSFSVFWLLHRNETCSFKTDQQTLLLIWMCKAFEIIIIIIIIIIYLAGCKSSLCNVMH